MNPMPVRAQIAGCGFRTIGGVQSLAEIGAQAGALPAAFVLTESESSADAQSGAGVFEQIDSVVFAVVIVISAAAAQRDQPAEEIETLKEAVKAALRAWQHPDADRPTAYRGARLISVAGGRVTVLLRFETSQRVRIVRQGV